MTDQVTLICEQFVTTDEGTLYLPNRLRVDVNPGLMENSLKAKASNGQLSSVTPRIRINRLQVSAAGLAIKSYFGMTSRVNIGYTCNRLETLGILEPFG